MYRSSSSLISSRSCSSVLTTSRRCIISLPPTSGASFDLRRPFSTRPKEIPPTTGPLEAFLQQGHLLLPKKKHSEIVQRLTGVVDPSSTTPSSKGGLLDDSWVAISAWMHDGPIPHMKYGFGMAIPVSSDQFLIPNSVINPPRKFSFHGQVFYHPKHGLRLANRILIQPKPRGLPIWCAFHLVKIDTLEKGKEEEKEKKPYSLESLPSFLLPHRAKHDDIILIPSFSPSIYSSKPSPTSESTSTPSKAFPFSWPLDSTRRTDVTTLIVREALPHLKENPSYISLGSLRETVHTHPLNKTPKLPSLSTPSASSTSPFSHSVSTTSPPITAFQGDFPLHNTMTGSFGHSLSSSQVNTFSFVVPLDSGGGAAGFNGPPSSFPPSMEMMTVSQPHFVKLYLDYILPNVEKQHPEFATYVREHNDFPLR